MKRMNTAVQITENTPDTTSVIRCSSGRDEAKYCISANEPPAHSIAGQTSQTCFHVPPSILTKVATSQKGTRIETHGSWWPAMVDSVSWSRLLTAASVTIGVPIAPHA